MWFSLAAWSCVVLTGAPRETIPSHRMRLSHTMRNRAVAGAFGTLVVFLLASSAWGQRGTAVGFAPAAHSGPVALRPGAGGSNLVHARRFGHRGHGRGFVGGYGFFPYWYPDAEPEPVEPPPAQVVFVPPAPAAAPAPPAKPAESLLLERHGDTWLRISASGDAREVTGERSMGPTSGSATSSTISPTAPADRTSGGGTSVVEIPAAVLVFRDGHTEQIRKYVITATTLSTSADYWSSGSWTRKIPIADLNVAETLKLNLQRGTGFSLPSRPGEVMMRP